MAKRKKPLEGSGAQKLDASQSPVEPLSTKPINYAQEQFCMAYVNNGGNATLAYKMAYPRSGPTTWDVCGPRLMGDARILAYIKVYRDERARLLNFTKEDALRILTGMATAVLPDFRKVVEKGDFNGLGDKAYALDTYKVITTTDKDGRSETRREIKAVSPGERKAIISDLSERLGHNADTERDRGAHAIGISDSIRRINSRRKSKCG